MVHVSGWADGAVEIDDDHGIFAEDIGFVTGSQADDLAGTGLEFFPAGRDDADAAAGVVQQVRRPAPCGRSVRPAGIE